MGRPRLREHVSYRFDAWMSRGTVAIMGLLGLATAAFVLAMAALVMALSAFPDGSRQGDFWDIAWGNLMRTLDPGTMGGDAGWAFRFLMLVVTVCGLIIVASLIGIISAAFDDKMAQLRKGRSRVLERDHSVILGWGPQVFRIVSEICVADESRPRSAIVILADRDKVEMEDELRRRVPHSRRTAVICRRGDPASPSDLRLTSPETARSVVVLTDGLADPDSVAIKIVLALTKTLPEGATGPNIVAALRDTDNMDAARLVGRGRAHWLPADLLVQRIMAQSCRQSGLSAVYAELLDFEGDEIYFTDQPSLVGQTFLDAQLAFEESVVVGIVRDDDVLLNPAPDLRIDPGNRLAVIAEDDSTIRLSAPPTARRARPQGSPTDVDRPERTLVLGSNPGLPGLLGELAHHVPAGSSVCVVTDSGVPPVAAPPGIVVEQRRADTTSRQVIDELSVGRYDHVLVLPDRTQSDAQSADARTIVTLLHLRDIADRSGVRFNIVSEMLDDRNRELAEVTRADDFIVSDQLVGLLLAQVGENGRLAGVFSELFSSEGSELHLRPAERYARPGEQTDFYGLAVAAAARGETAIGYRVAADAREPERGYGIHINPRKPDPVVLGPDDAVIVLAGR